MSLKVIRKGDRIQMPWKNGQGVTAQIDISPAGSSFSSDDFLWRLSSATVGAPGPFSQFPGCDRWLVVISGQGLALNGKTFGPFTPLHFSGEENIHADLLQNTVVDLGLIYRRDKVKARMSVHQMPQNQSELLQFNSTFGYIFCESGELKCGEHMLNEGDCIFIENQSIKISTQESNSLSIILTLELR